MAEKHPSRRQFLTGALVLGMAVSGNPLRADPGWRTRPASRPLRPGPDGDALLREADLGGETAWVVMDAKDGRVLDARLPDTVLPPASTLKAVTALYALDRLGKDYRFQTRILSDDNTLILEGNGDPVLDSDNLASLARQAAQTLAGPYDRFIVAPIWPADDIAQIDPLQASHLSYNPTVSGVNLNFNRVHLSWRMGAGGPVLGLEARGNHVSPRAYTIAIHPVSRDTPLFSYDGTGTGEEWTVAANALRQPGSRWLPVRRPALYAGDVFQTLARAEGLPLPNPEIGHVGPDAYEVVRHDSPTLGVIVDGMLKYSTNLTAEVLGLRASGETDLASSASAMRDWVRSQNVQGDFHFADHSGLSPGSRVTAVMMAGLLASLGRNAHLKDAMPEPRLNGGGQPTSWPAGLQVVAKTGTLNFVSNLVGYIDGPKGGRLAFAILSGDMGRRTATAGQELPAGVAGWTRRSRQLQHGLITNWAARFG